MQPARNSQLIGDLGRIFAGELFPPGDRNLLADFVTHRDADAFEVLVERHGPMVRGVCRRVLGEGQDVDDAFQATFLILFLKARRIGNPDRLAPWLFGVATRVALKARTRAARRRVRLGGFAARAVAVAPNHDLCDVLPLIDAEIARLPVKLRQAVVLCLVEGATPDEAAERLDCPVGTVKSRLARGREALRARLGRRGVTPGIALAALDRVAPATVSTALIHATRFASLTTLVAGPVLALTRGVAPAMITKSTAVAALILGGFALAGGEVAFLRSRSVAQDQTPAAAPPPPAATAPNPTPTPDAPRVAAPSATTPPAEPPLADRVAAILAEYETKNTTLWAAMAKAVVGREGNETYARLAPDFTAYCRRLNSLALEKPDDPAARDACIWVIDKSTSTSDTDLYGDEFARAAALLVRHHGNDPIAISPTLTMNNGVVSAHRDALLLGFLAGAESRESKGLIRLALAQYLEIKARWVEAVRKSQTLERGGNTYRGMTGDDGKRYDKFVPYSNEEYAYSLSLRYADPVALQADAERFYHEVIDDYSDVPWASSKIRNLRALLDQPTPTRNGRPMTAAEIAETRKAASPKWTLGPIATARLDEMHNITPGKPAPEIDGMTLDGKPLKLSDYRGKVVVLTFWGSWCGPCIAEMPSERALAEKFKDRPFAMLGVDCNDKKDAAQQVIDREKITWPNWHDGSDGDGPIVRKYHIRGYPSSFVIDANGIIRHKKLIGPSLEAAVAKLLDEATPR